ncbi:hypothetical protein G4Y73_08800 [Wenzhouxiangella sp. XN201]|uniref:hypothetical protein n=1 Tax=Wenzhouxiangella sp. XN201 TaxID=2710755 RepID=UPI0013C64432|nr:hypothetical protein [Wenzhouxiangella sp. XN201]NEZ04241.1 hypothetical protein [Wenzhouxiangella sp. XN201]
MTFTQLLSGFALPHALVGTVALVTFWTAGLARKGSPLHKGVGKVYMVAMIGVILTAIPLTASMALKGQWIGATFLAYLVILVSHSCRMAWLAVRCKRDFERYIGMGFRFSAIVLTVAGTAVVTVGLWFEAWLLIIFGLLGPLGGWDAWNLLRKGPQSPKWWLKEHYGAMIGNGVATHIAFMQIGLMRLVPELGSTVIQHLAWFGPLAVGIAAGYWLDRRYLRPRPTPVEPAV